jgi:hypothetical protein
MTSPEDEAALGRLWLAARARGVPGPEVLIEEARALVALAARLGL